MSFDFFGVPHNERLLAPANGEAPKLKKYEPVTFGEFVGRRLAELYNENSH